VGWLTWRTGTVAPSSFQGDWDPESRLILNKAVIRAGRGAILA